MQAHQPAVESVDDLADVLVGHGSFIGTTRTVAVRPCSLPWGIVLTVAPRNRARKRVDLLDSKESTPEQWSYAVPS